MAVTILCPRLTCRAVLRVPDAVRGKRVRCSGCGTTFLVPASSPPPSKTEATNPPAEKEAGAAT